MLKHNPCRLAESETKHHEGRKNNKLVENACLRRGRRSCHRTWDNSDGFETAHPPLPQRAAPHLAWHLALTMWRMPRIKKARLVPGQETSRAAFFHSRVLDG